MGTLWSGGQIYTMEREKETVEAVFVEDGTIIAVGLKQDLEKLYKNRISKVVNLKGHTMFPGFVDSHMHLIGHGEKLMKLDFSGMTSSKEITDAIHEYVKDKPADEWIIGEGWNENQLPDRKIFHRIELDELSPDNPLMLKRICRHAVVVNTRALELAGITDDTPNPEGGVIVRDANRHATGYLLDQAQEFVKAVIPEVTEDYIQNALRLSIEDCLSKGLVGGHTEDLNYYGGFERTFGGFQNSINEDGFKFRTNLLVHHEAVDDMHRLGYSFGKGGDFLKFGAMKIFSDGSIGGRTALLSHPYNDSPDTAGVAIHSLDELKKLVQKARRFMMPVAVHAIGDLAFEYVLDAIEEFPPLQNQRDRLIHAQILRKELIDRAKQLPVILDIQPRFVVSDFPWVVERIGEMNMEYCYAWKTLLRAGLHCAGGSDAPIEPIDPLLGIHAAVARKKPEEDMVFMPEERLSVYEAVQLFTTGSAYAVGKEGCMGQIAPGYKADFTILDQDIFKIQADEILRTNVMMTVVDNTVMYKR
ncbi:amidohydrolase [Bacillus sp. REN16]|uniref:amidohydrolase n=1 Tax=Bacillus sp. REN16 TaxID=2887296 RepID=UPI001E339BA3|nr:amidohydrolase [Bacillus sp. REN16]MCC3356419.1 amidohydrolase [Bacillus sp. REN16]